MATVFEIPLLPQPQKFSIQLGATTYRMGYVYRDPFGWFLDLADVNGAPLVSGVPLVTGANLLAQYASLGFRFGLVVQTDGVNPDAPPTFDNLGAASHVYAVLP